MFKASLSGISMPAGSVGWSGLGRKTKKEKKETPKEREKKKKKTPPRTKLVLQRHDNLDGVEAVQTQSLDKVRIHGHLREMVSNHVDHK
jgi:ribosomal protein S30